MIISNRSAMMYPAKRMFGYCSQVVFREVFSCILHENSEFHGAKRRFLPYLCIAKRVIIYSMPLFGMV